ncbi:hypothetical protein [Burkholderia ubonensis]|uniref:hypothetical protein n=1 Tax=Burkholderia ubonensis TaxID=101571 RepID=UPI000ABF29B5|nr:hypothetical protein [Burkholderia ubonensis]
MGACDSICVRLGPEINEVNASLIDFYVAFCRGWGAPFGCQINRVFDCSVLMPFINLYLNNVSDAFDSEVNLLNTHEFEREVLSPFATLWHVQPSWRDLADRDLVFWADSAPHSLRMRSARRADDIFDRVLVIAQGDEAHIFTMPHETQSLIDELIDAIDNANLFRYRKPSIQRKQKVGGSSLRPANSDARDALWPKRRRRVGPLGAEAIGDAVSRI